MLSSPVVVELNILKFRIKAAPSETQQAFTMRRLSSFLAIALLLSHLEPGSVAAQSARPSPTQTSDKYADKLPAFEDFVRQQMEKNKVPGLTIGFIKDDYIWVK